MISNEEKVLKYLSGLMTGEENAQFELELKTSDELNNLFQKYSRNFSDLKKLSEADIDDRYFSTLLPKVRQKLSVEKRRPLVYRLAPVIPALTLAVFIVLNFFYFDINSPDSFDDIISEVITNSDSGAIAEIVDDYPSYFFEDYSINIDLDDSYFEESNFSTIELAEDFNLSFIDDYSFYENLSEEDIDHIYNRLIDKKIL